MIDWKAEEETSAAVVVDLTGKIVEYAGRDYSPVAIVTGMFRTAIITALATKCTPETLILVFVSLLKECVSINKEARNESNTAH